MLSGQAWLQPAWTSPLILAALLLVACGVIQELRRPQPLAGWYVLAYGALITLWPFDEGGRFLVPIAPLVFLFAIVGARSAFDWIRFKKAPQVAIGMAISGAVLVLLQIQDIPPHWRSASRQTIASVLVTMLFAGAGAVVWLSPRAYRLAFRTPSVPRWILASWVLLYASFCTPALVEAIASNRSDASGNQRKSAVGVAAKWIIANTTRDDVVMAEDLASIHFLTGRQVAQLPETDNPVVLRRALHMMGPGYVLINDALPNPYVLPTDPERFSVMQSLREGSFTLASSFAGGRIFRFEPSGGT